MRFQPTGTGSATRVSAAATRAVNSLDARRDKMYTFSATAHIGVRPWSGGEVYFQPEVVVRAPSPATRWAGPVFQRRSRAPPAPT